MFCALDEIAFASVSFPLLDGMLRRVPFAWRRQVVHLEPSGRGDACRLLREKGALALTIVQAVDALLFRTAVQAGRGKKSARVDGERRSHPSARSCEQVSAELDADGKAASGDDEESMSDAMKTLTGQCALLNCKLDKTKNDVDFLLKGKPGLRKLMELFPDLSAEDLHNVLKDHNSDANAAATSIMNETVPGEVETSCAQSATHTC